MKDNPKRFKSDKYCRFHRDRGHTTEECHHFKNEIEKLIQRGYLKEYVNQGPKHQPRDSTSKQAGNGDNLAGVIAVISGGPAGGDSANARRALTRAARGVTRKPLSKFTPLDRCKRMTFHSANKT
ncbi:UNVERIFIED_CONTAM: hypothetical protein Sindi_0959800 [Sesamum indicum]